MNEPATPTPRLTPPELPERWLNAAREERLRRWLKRGLVLALTAGLVWLALNWWIVEAYWIGRERAVAEACADSPFASGAVIAAGGGEAIATPDADALEPYRSDPDGRRDAALRIRDRASLVPDRDLASAAVAVTSGGPFQTKVEIGHVEVSCRRYMEAEGLAG
ncbi:hypothetical protein [Nitriliruptor alkaliphilus]|uniref:hypothetical protein n=1 Tax=Nitriliruptor alkaliphilus TaxID=427918 RepID=UPI0012ECF3B3|nr:hypothetical protein [Nitriliruptor alkaliphilus]